MSDEQALPPGDVAQDPNAGAPSAVAQSADVTQSSAPPVSNDAGTLPSAASSPVEDVAALAAADVARKEGFASAAEVAAMTFEQRVEQRFLQVEAFLMKLPHSIAHAFSQGSAEPEELAKRAVAHLLDQNQ